MEISGTGLLIVLGCVVAWYIGDETWHGLKWIGIHTAHVAVHVWHFLHL